MVGRRDDTGRGGGDEGRRSDSRSQYKHHDTGGRHQQDGGYGRGRRGVEEGGSGRGGGQGERIRGGGRQQYTHPPQSRHPYRPDHTPRETTSESMAKVQGPPLLPPQPAAFPVTSVPQGFLPPFLPGASSLVEQLDQRLLVVLRDGRHLVGTLRTFDQFSNMVLEDTSERRILIVRRSKEDEDGKGKNEIGNGTICYQADIKLGLYIVRGDSVVIVGEVNENDEGDVGSNNGSGTNKQKGFGSSATENKVGRGRKIHVVSLEELERIQEEEQEKESTGKAEEQVVWEFDLDLVA